MMAPNIHLISNIYVFQHGKTMEDDNNFHRQIRGKDAIKKLLQTLMPHLRGVNDERSYDAHLHLLTEEQRFQWKEGGKCSWSEEYTFGYTKNSEARVFENRCQQKRECDVYKRGGCWDKL